MPDLYSVLQVAPKASDAEIKAAFRSVAKTCHPDVRPGDRKAEQAFHEAREAYRYLGNPETRRMYDDYLESQLLARRLRRRRAMRTMSTTFVLTVMAVGLTSAWWQGRLPIGPILAAMIERAGAHEVARPVALKAEANSARTPDKPSTE
jgi:curved DNA-binding protein CbpA